MISIPEKKVVKNDNDFNAKTREIDPRPSFTITVDELPQIKEWSVGKKYTLEIEVEMTGSRIEDWGENKDKLTASFRVSGIMEDTDDDDEDESRPFDKVVKERE